MKHRQLWLIGVVAVLAGLGGTIAFTHTMAPPSDIDVSTQQPSAQHQFRVTYEPSIAPPPVGQLHTWTIRITMPDGAPVDGATIAVAGDMPQHGHGLPTQPRVTRGLGDGAYLVEGMRFQMGGWWVVDFTIDAHGQSDTVRFNLSL